MDNLTIRLGVSSIGFEIEKTYPVSQASQDFESDEMRTIFDQFKEHVCEVANNLPSFLSSKQYGLARSVGKGHLTKIIARLKDENNIRGAIRGAVHRLKNTK